MRRTARCVATRWAAGASSASPRRPRYSHGQRYRRNPQRAHPVNRHQWPPQEPCPGCGQPDGVELTSATARVIAWKCTRCAMGWAISVVNPQLRSQAYPVDLAVVVEEIGAAQSLLREVVTLVQDAPTIPDRELRTRLLTLAELCAR